MKINELLEFLEEEGLSQFVEVVKEPEYSKGQLLKFQSEFGMSSIGFYELYITGLLDNQLCEEKMNEWAYNYRVFIRANGDLNDLLNDSRTRSNEDGNEFPSSLFLP